MRLDSMRLFLAIETEEEAVRASFQIVDEQCEKIAKMTGRPIERIDTLICDDKEYDRPV